ncbi:conserved hypothetical protein [Gammaproteobacteria bacterium]
MAMVPYNAAMPWSYLTYGLSIRSDIELPELVTAPTSINPDVFIAAVSAAPLDCDREATLGQVTPTLTRFRVKGVARYEIEQGRHITVVPESAADDGDIRLYLLGNALGVLLHQRGLLPLHVGAIATQWGAVAFAGASGAGKSTLTATLALRGYPLLCDDTAVVVPRDGDTPLLYPGFPRLKLWRDTLTHLRLDHRAGVRDHSRFDKFHLPAKAFFHAEPLPLHALFVLERALNDDDARIESITGMRAVEQLSANTYNRRLVGRMARGAANLQQCATVAHQVAVFRYRRPWVLERMEESLMPLLKIIGVPPRRCPARSSRTASRNPSTLPPSP